jgi:hypothetical protein
MKTVSRILATIVGGYAATVGVVAFTSVLIALLFDMQRSEAVVLMTMIGFLGYTAIIIWGFAERRLIRLWTVLGGVAVGSHLAAIWLAQRLPPVVQGG